MADKHPRLADLDPADLTTEQREVYDRIITGPRGQVAGPLRVWLHNPQLADRAQALGQYARYDTCLPPVLSELAILVTARIWSSGFEWAHHAPIARAAGLRGAVVTAIAAAEVPPFDDDMQQAVFAFSVELHRDRRVSDGAYAMAIEFLGEQAVLDLVAICGYYTLISMTINTYEIAGGDGPTLPRLATPPKDFFRQTKD